MGKFNYILVDVKNNYNLEKGERAYCDSRKKCCIEYIYAVYILLTNVCKHRGNDIASRFHVIMK